MPDQKPQEDEKRNKPNKHTPPAGPHARPDLTDKDKTPGTGSLPDDAGSEGDVGPD